jgi:hypothetical protein
VFLEEPGDRQGSAELDGLGGHGELGVVGQHGYQLVEVEALERVDGAMDGGGFGRRSWQGHVVRVGAGAEAGAGADERAVDGRRGGAEDAGGLGRGEAEHVAQDQDRPLLRRQVLEARDERQRDRFSCVVAGFGAGGYVAEQHIGVGLEPPWFIGPHR